MSGFDLTSSEIGHWNLDIHHTYNFQEGNNHCNIVVFVNVYNIVVFVNVYNDTLRITRLDIKVITVSARIFSSLFCIYKFVYTVTQATLMKDTVLSARTKFETKS